MSDHAPLAASTRAEVAVIGGGLAGLSAALHLARAGKDVVLLEAAAIGSGATGRSTGMISPGVGGTILDLVRRLGDEGAARAFRASLDAVRTLVDFVKDERLACDLETTGQLVVATSRRHARALERQAHALASLGFAAPLLDGRAIERALGTGAYLAALRFPTAALVDPTKLCRQLARALSKIARVHERTMALAIEPGATVRIATATGVVRAERCILANDAWVARLGFLRGRVVPLHAHVVATEPLPREATWRGREGVVDARTFFDFFRLTKDDRLIFGGRAPVLRESAKARTFERLEREIAAIFPALAGVEIERRWTGPMGFTLDRLPVVGEVAPNVIASAGWCGHGIALSFAAGAAIAREELASLPWHRATAPLLPPDPLRSWGLAAYLAALGLGDLGAAPRARRSPIPFERRLLREAPLS